MRSGEALNLGIKKRFQKLSGTAFNIFVVPKAGFAK
jgi:hypothetical protein